MDKRFQTGLNMVEIMAILVILALFGAMAIPRSGEQPDNQAHTGPDHNVGLVKTAHATAIADLKRFPTVDELSGYVDGSKSGASARGVQVFNAGTQYTIPTYSDSGCRHHTKAVTDPVACVGTL